MPETLDQQHVLNVVYRHFVDERHRPAIDDNAELHYHYKGQVSFIGLFDDGHRLNSDSAYDSDGTRIPLVRLFSDLPDLIAVIFDVERISDADAVFLSTLQLIHDRVAFECHPATGDEAWNPVGRFDLYLSELAESFGFTLPR